MDGNRIDFYVGIFSAFLFQCPVGKFFSWEKDRGKGSDKSGRALIPGAIGTIELLALRINNMALYGGCLLLFGQFYVNPSYAMITLAMAGLMAMQAGLFYFVWEDAAVKKFMAFFSFLLFVIFISWQWSGLTVTLLWLLTAVIVFAIGAVKKWPVTRMAAVILMGATLIKLVLIDSLVFTTVQKVIAYVLLGVLLLVVSFFIRSLKRNCLGMIHNHVYRWLRFSSDGYRNFRRLGFVMQFSFSHSRRR